MRTATHRGGLVMASITITLSPEEARALLAAARRGTYAFDPVMGDRVSGACEHGQPCGWHCPACGERNVAAPGPDGYRGSAAGPWVIDHYYSRCGGCQNQVRLREHRDIANQEPHLRTATGLLALALR